MSHPIYLLDTNICIYIIKKKPIEVLHRFSGLSFGDVAVSSITAAELDYGVSKSGSDRNMATLEKFLAPLEILPFDNESARQYGRLRANLERQGTPIGPLDTLIAAHALALNSVLVTNNVREFSRVPMLKLDNWVEAAQGT